MFSLKISRAVYAAGLGLAVAGAVLAARPLVHLARRTHAGITARTAWARWVRSGTAQAGIGEPAGWMTVSSAGIDTIVLWGDGGENLRRYPSLSDRFSPFSRTRGVKVVAAHRDTHFRHLGSVRTGDEVRLVLKDGQILEYRVCDIEIVPKELAAMRVSEKDGADWLVLMTCHPFSFAGAAPDRFLVWARPAGCPPVKREFRKPLALCAGGRSSFPSPQSGTGLIAGASPAFPPSAREGRPLAPPRFSRRSLDSRKGHYSAEGGGSAFFLFPAVFSTISPRYFGSSTPAISATS